MTKSLHLLFFRNPDSEPDLAILAAGLDASAVHPGHCLCYGEPQTIVVSLTVPGLISPIETVKKMLELLWRNIIALIYHTEDNRMGLPF